MLAAITKKLRFIFIGFLMIFMFYPPVLNGYNDTINVDSLLTNDGNKEYKFIDKAIKQDSLWGIEYVNLDLKLKPILLKNKHLRNCLNKIWDILNLQKPFTETFVLYVYKFDKNKYVFWPLSGDEVFLPDYQHKFIERIKGYYNVGHLYFLIDKNIESNDIILNGSQKEFMFKAIKFTRPLNFDPYIVDINLSKDKFKNGKYKSIEPIVEMITHIAKNI